ncbi:TPA: hypothetical protein ACKAOQ_001346 [Streptococcus pneumoniae]|uniref:hypothetical protein n=1 Tax=Streptococcus infantis TaxID=68892 RepID=UPI001CBBCB99|nr:hypothetical protein [Streptococcus infantis]MBZ2109918.1 hypothetical protein [Streptococcus infantis]MBZ2111766.1 hypothetical protein [Streptococcus infantis]
MTEPTLSSQLLGVATVFICLFVAMFLIAIKEEQAKERKKQLEEQDRAIIEVYHQGRNQFNNIARMNIRNCDRKFTYDTEKPEGLREELLALPYPKEQ